ncbi:MAG: hypothetical protein MJ185_04330 [Treponema sp.]|nr:hypothetical protein [Treponema sp.]
MKKLVKRIGKLYFLLYMLLSIAGGLTLFSCKNNIQPMLDKTNGHFKAEEEEYDDSLIPGDEGFEESSMLNPIYYVGNRMSIVLAAPEAARYYWTLYSLEKTETAVWVGADEVLKTEVPLPPNVDRFGQNFALYIPEIPDMTPGTYELKLQVLDKDENYYSDIAQLVVYDQYYLETIKEE